MLWHLPIQQKGYTLLVVYNKTYLVSPNLLTKFINPDSTRENVCKFDVDFFNQIESCEISCFSTISINNPLVLLWEVQKLHLFFWCSIVHGPLQPAAVASLSVTRINVGNFPGLAPAGTLAISDRQQVMLGKPLGALSDCGQTNNIGPPCWGAALAVSITSVLPGLTGSPQNAKFAFNLRQSIFWPIALNPWESILRITGVIKVDKRIFNSKLEAYWRKEKDRIQEVLKSVSFNWEATTALVSPESSIFMHALLVTMIIIACHYHFWGQSWYGVVKMNWLEIDVQTKICALIQLLLNSLLVLGGGIWLLFLNLAWHIRLERGLSSTSGRFLFVFNH